MDSSVVISTIWFHGDTYRILKASFVDDQPFVEVDPPNRALQERIEGYLRNYQNFHTIPLTFSGSYKYFAEDTAEFEEWRFQQSEHHGQA